MGAGRGEVGLAPLRLHETQSPLFRERYWPDGAAQSGASAAQRAWAAPAAPLATVPPTRAPLHTTPLLPAALQALDKVISLVDPADEQYCAQRALVGGDAAFFITELLADPAAAVRAAEAVAALTHHSAEAQARLTAGALVSLDSRVERVGLNPCQSGAACWPLRRLLHLLSPARVVVLPCQPHLSGRRWSSSL